MPRAVPVRVRRVPSRPRPLAVNAALVLAAAALVFGAYGEILGLGMLGWDGWPLVAAGRIDSLGDVFGAFGRELMDGRYPFGRFYRPLVHLSFGVDHALYGLDPAGYHRTDIVWLALATVLVGATAARLSPRRAVLAAVVAGTLFALHPVQLEIVPVSPRRADTMALVFVLATLLALPRADAALSPARAVWLALLAFCAGASKETGVLVAPVAIAAARWAWPRGESSAERWRAALRRSAPVLVGVALYVAARTVVLGGLGGHEGLPPAEAGIVERWGELVRGAVLPRPLGGFGATPSLGVTALGVLLLAGGLLAARAEGVRVLAAVWVACLLGLTGLAERSHEWYSMLLTVPLVLLAGCAVATRGRTAAVVVALVGVSWIRATPRLDPPERLETAGRLATRLVETLEEQLGDAPPGCTARVDPWISQLAPAPDGVRALHVAYVYTVEAFLELRWPNRAFYVIPGPLDPVPSAAPNGLVQLVPRRP